MKNVLNSTINLVPFRLRQHIRQMPGLASLQRWLLTHATSDEPFVHRINAGPAKGTRFEISLPADKAIWAGTYELQFAQAIAKHTTVGVVCYDIGGFRGYMSAVMAVRGASRVVVFEPLPANHQAMNRLRAINPDFPIEVVAAAVGDADGVARFKVMPDSSMGKLAISKFQSIAESEKEIEVRICQLDSLVERNEIPAPGLIKVDVEGAEFVVLQGARRTLAAHRPILFMEIHSRQLEEQCTQMLSALNYNVVRLEREVVAEEDTRHLVCLPR
jgi:FkbM family methyltransferase